jgi:hypothetical protein
MEVDAALLAAHPTTFSFQKCIDMSASPTTSAPAVRTSDGDRSFGAPVRGLWVWWHLLSLDAPTVAVVWCWFFATAFGVSLPVTALVTLALGTWCVYVADRLLDGWRSADMTDLRDRHWFYLRHRRPFVIAWMAAAVPLAFLILFRVPPAVRSDDVTLCLIGIGYFLLIHNRAEKYPFSKELFVGLLFSIATAVPTWTRMHEQRGLLLIAVSIFGAACWLNCVAIQTWEDAEARGGHADGDFAEFGMHPLAGHQGKRPRPGLTCILGNHLAAFAIMIAALAVLLACLPVAKMLWPLLAAVATSCVIFLALIQRSTRFSALSLRILADGALLTPLMFLLYMH